MCRLAAYVGPPISLESFLLQPEHSLVKQSWRPKEMREATMNADGFGISWFAEDQTPAVYKNTHPIWSDANLHSLGRSLIRPRWLAAVRSATMVSDISYANTQPFTNDRFLFTHNGYLEDFAHAWRSEIRGILQPQFENQVHGTTDSEYLFALFSQFYEKTGEITAAMTELVELLEKLAQGKRALLSFIVSSTTQLVALRHAIGDASPTLYYHIEETGSGKAVHIASESLTAHEGWTQIEENRLLSVSEIYEISGSTI
jgi:glutamine amidotransferase